MHLNIGHHHLREQIPSASGGIAQTQRERPNSAGASKLEPKLESILYGGSAQTRRSAGAPKLCNSDDASMRDPYCEVMLPGRTSHTRVENDIELGMTRQEDGGGVNRGS